MQDPTALLALASAGTAATAIASAAALRGWRDWLELRRSAVETTRRARPERPTIAELKARVRRLEAIANGNAG